MYGLALCRISAARAVDLRHGPLQPFGRNERKPISAPPWLPQVGKYIVTNGKDTFPTSSMAGVAAAEATIFARLSIFDEAQFLPRHRSSSAQPRDLSTFRKRYAASHSPIMKRFHYWQI